MIVPTTRIRHEYPALVRSHCGVWSLPTGSSLDLGDRPATFPWTRFCGLSREGPLMGADMHLPLLFGSFKAVNASDLSREFQLPKWPKAITVLFLARHRRRLTLRREVHSYSLQPSPSAAAVKSLAHRLSSTGCSTE